MLEIYPWQTEQMHRLLLMHQQNRLPHALLLSGPDGIGLKQFALVFVMRTLCLSNNNKLEDACGHCKSCELFKGKSHPDLYFIEPEEKGKTIKVEQIRELIFTAAAVSEEKAGEINALVEEGTIHGLNYKGSLAKLRRQAEKLGNLKKEKK